MWDVVGFGGKPRSWQIGQRSSSDHNISITVTCEIQSNQRARSDEVQRKSSCGRDFREHNKSKERKDFDLIKEDMELSEEPSKDPDNQQGSSVFDNDDEESSMIKPAKFVATTEEIEDDIRNEEDESNVC